MSLGFSGDCICNYEPIILSSFKLLGINYVVINLINLILIYFSISSDVISFHRLRLFIFRKVDSSNCVSDDCITYVLLNHWVFYKIGNRFMNNLWSKISGTVERIFVLIFEQNNDMNFFRYMN